MKFILIVFSLAVLCSARPQKYNGNPQNAEIVTFENNNIGVGAYNFAYETSDGTSHQQTAEIVNAGTENEHLVIKGSYSYVGTDGVQYTVNYIADENGFQPQGPHIPKQQSHHHSTKDRRYA